MKQHALHRWTVLVVAVIYVAILVGTILSFRPDAFPVPTVRTVLSGVWADDVEQYLTEHLGFHDVLFRAKSRADLFVGEKMIRGVYVTEDMLLEKVVTEEVPDAEHAASPVNAFYNASGIPTYLILVPSASEIYKTTLPANAVTGDQKNRIQAIYNETAVGVRCVDACNVLSSMKSSYIFYRTDTHWTCYGCYCVYQAAIQKMGLSAVPYDNYVISHLSTEFHGDLYARTLYEDVKSDVLDLYRDEDGVQVTQVTAYYADGSTEDRGQQFYAQEALHSDDMYRFYLGTPCERLVIRTNADNGRRLLLFKDDFADCMLPFLMQHYSEICVIDLTRVGSGYQDIVDPAEYTQALFLCSLKNWDGMW